MSREKPILYIVVPCYNEEQVLPHTNPMFVEKIEQLVKKEEIHPNSKIMYVNDGSKDRTWELIESYAESIYYVVGVSQSRNRGHQSSVLAGMYAVYVITVIRTLLLNELQPKVFIKCYVYLEQKLFLIMQTIDWCLKDS